MTETDLYLIKAKTAGMPGRIIAARLGVKESDLEARWQKILQEMSSHQSTGYNSLCEWITQMANQYQLLGESLKVTASALSDIMGEPELRMLVTKDPEVTIKNLQEHAIVLRSWVPPVPAPLPAQPPATSG